MQIFFFIPVLILTSSSYLLASQIAVTSEDENHAALYFKQLKDYQTLSAGDSRLDRLIGGLEEFIDSYQKGKKNFAHGIVDANEVTCSACRESAPPSSLAGDCGHRLCDNCTLGNISAHRGTDRFFLCWAFGCEQRLSAVGLGSYLGQHKNPALYLAAVKFLIRSAGVDAEFCPHCSGSVTLKSAAEGYSRTCPSCKKTICFSCGKPDHAEIPCNELGSSQNEIILIARRLLLNRKGQSFGFCPHCGVLTEYANGCDTMTCGQNAPDKPPIPFENHSGLSHREESLNQTAQRVAGCGKEFIWEGRKSLESYLRQHDHGWERFKQQKIRAGRRQDLTRAQFAARLEARLSMAGFDLREVDLSDFDFSDTTFEGVSFASSLLTAEQALILLARGANLSYADLRRGDFCNADLEGMNLEGMHLGGANLRGANLRGANLRGVNLSGANLEHANLEHANLERANFYEADLHYANFVGANLEGASFRCAGLRNTNFSYASFVGLDLCGADFRNANLSYASFEDADLQYARLWGANLEKVSLVNDVLKNANIWSANLEDFAGELILRLINRIFI